MFVIQRDERKKTKSSSAKVQTEEEPLFGQFTSDVQKPKKEEVFDASEVESDVTGFETCREDEAVSSHLSHQSLLSYCHPEESKRN